MTRSIIILSAFLFFLIPVKATMRNVPVLKNDILQKKEQPDSVYRFIVSFISKGGGTDRNARQQFVQFAEDYGKKKGIKIKAETINWGREGETDYCLKLSELNKREQKKFIDETKALLKTSELVRYNENEKCRHLRKNSKKK